MANEQPNRSLHPQLKRVLLKKFNLTNSFAGNKVEVDIKFGKQIDFELFDTSDDEFIRLALTIELDANGSAVGSKKSKKQLLSVNALYCGRYVFPPNTSYGEAQSYINDMNNQDIFASEVYGIAIFHFKSQLELTGFTTKSMPFN